MQFDRDKFHLVYFEAFLEEYYEEVDYAEYSRVEPRYEWKKHLKIESFDGEREAFERAAELLWLVDYDHRIDFLGIFKGDVMVYNSREVNKIADEIYLQEVTA